LNGSLWGSLFAGSFDVSLDFNGSDRSVGMSFVAGAKNPIDLHQTSLEVSAQRYFHPHQFSVTEKTTYDRPHGRLT